MKNNLFLVGLVAALGAPAQAALFISEVHSTGSSALYAGDWFELTNTGAASLDITGWKVDDNSNLFTSALALNGVTSIGAGQSVVFIEGDDLTETAFVSAWFSGSAPSGFTIGSYTGSGIGLGSGGDAVNIFDALGALQARVTFPAATAGVSFDNAAFANDTAISTLSVAGVNGAFVSAINETGSPGVVPEPSTMAVLFSGIGMLALRRRRLMR